MLQVKPVLLLALLLATTMMILTNLSVTPLEMMISSRVGFLF